MSSDSDASSQPSRAGAYGFTRREIIALAALILVCVALGFIARRRDHQGNSQAAWVVEDVLVGGSASNSGIDETEEPGDANRIDSTTSNVPQSELININAADTRELLKLPGIGPELAKRIADERTAHGAFVSLSDLQRVKGIGPKRAALLAGWVTFSAPLADTAAQR